VIVLECLLHRAGISLTTSTMSAMVGQVQSSGAAGGGNGGGPLHNSNSLNTPNTVPTVSA